MIYPATMADDEARNRAVEEWRKKIVAHKEVESRVRALREEVKEAKKEYDKTEDDLKALQSVGQIIGEVLRQLDEERCECGRKDAGLSGSCSGAITMRAGRWTRVPQLLPPASLRCCCPCCRHASHSCWSVGREVKGRLCLWKPMPAPAVIVKSSSGPRYVVGCRTKVDKSKLTPNTRVALDVTTLTIMRILPREVDPVVFNMTQVGVTLLASRAAVLVPLLGVACACCRPVITGRLHARHYTPPPRAPCRPAGGPRQGGLLLHWRFVGADPVRVLGALLREGSCS